MLDDKTKARLAQTLRNSQIRTIVAEELAILLADKPTEISAEDYCKSVAEMIVGELRERLCEPMLPAEQVDPAEQAAHAEHADTEAFDSDEVDHGGDLNGAIKRLTTGVEHALLSGNLQMLRALGEAIAQRDTGDSKHNPRVTLYSTRLAETMELETSQIQALMKGSFLHDIGKIGIRDEIILKPAGLSADERRTMNSHAELGAAIIRGVKWLNDAREVVRSHHEHFDGNGYPDGLKADAIPINARVFAIVDVFDALTSKRMYKPAYSYEKTMQIIFDKRGNHFDPWIVESFANISRQLYDELAWEPYHLLDAKLRRKVAFHFGLGSAADA